MWHGNGGAELALAPVLFALLGFAIDGALNTRPIFTILGAVVGLGGAVANVYFRYRQRMTKLEAERKAAFVAEHGEPSGPRFGAREHVELPSYVLESDLELEDLETASELA